MTLDEVREKIEGINATIEDAEVQATLSKLAKLYWAILEDLTNALLTIEALAELQEKARLAIEF